MKEEKKPRLWISTRWWEYPALDILGTIVGHETAEVGGEMGTEESEGEGYGD